MKNLISTKAMQNAHIIASATDYTFSTCLKLGWKVAKGELDIKQAKKTKEFSFSALMGNVATIGVISVLTVSVWLITCLVIGSFEYRLDTKILDFGFLFVSIFASFVALLEDEFKSIFNKTIERV